MRIAGITAATQTNLYLELTIPINTTEKKFLKLWYSLHDSSPQGALNWYMTPIDC